MNQNVNFLYWAARKKFSGDGATVHSKKAYMVPLIFNLGTVCRWVVSFTHWPLHSKEKSPPIPVWTLWNREKSIVPARNQTM